MGLNKKCLVQIPLSGLSYSLVVESFLAYEGLSI